ncbi:hypothetical protein P280DRAFT_512767 [Massarina eburnea CBS 473.64]|uniref:Uncharacterized protein n=1 Tax=Massarina eburnea CBS 473.64 TaxID=1395130 RepID=A0A6A6SGD6_9PLEO|nr:hypothetical protein P280DRAFT_512767 [Massarina eburnea CBS 473.64]
MPQPHPPSANAYGPIPVRRKPIANPGIAIRTSQASLDVHHGHSRSRTTSSGIFPPPAASPTTANMSSQYPPQMYQSSLRRTPTSSTSSTAGTPNRSNSGAMRRSSSGRSGTSPTSYVALMRKQKATVWCDRAQYEDPRILAQQRQAKMRATMEVVGGPHHTPLRNASGSSSVAAGVRSKVRHHGVPKASLYAPVATTGSGVPMRLSASEVDEGDSEDGSVRGTSGTYHHRTGSGRSSLGSGRRMSYAAGGRHSSGSTPPNGTNSPEMGDLIEEETPVQGHNPSDYFPTKTGLSEGSGSSGERNFGDVGEMPQSLPKPAQQDKSDLHRRGSVDERTTTMTNTRLFIANPDLSD